MARFPKLINAEVLRNAASPTDTHAIRIELRGVPSNVPYRLSGKRGQTYLLHYAPEERAHILDFPVSIWMEDNEAVARNLLGVAHRTRPIILCVPWHPHPSTTPHAPDEPPTLPEEDLHGARSPEQKAIDALSPPPPPPTHRGCRKHKPKTVTEPPES
jgi:hypothetical protein